MCGIAGIISIDGKARELVPAINAMTDQMKERGPDDEGFFVLNQDSGFDSFSGADTAKINESVFTGLGFPEKPLSQVAKTSSFVALGHRRLSIVDLSPLGHQPMCSIDRRYWIVYNGEIYNYREIAKELESLGVRLHGHSDTEVLLNAYIVWGEKCLNRFNGMFAFAIWDNKDKSLFCARDRIGIKPLYYTVVDGQLIFGSDIKTLLASGKVPRQIDYQGLYLAMAFGIATRPITAFKGIKALQQGSWMRISEKGSIEIQRYWQIPTNQQNLRMSEREAVELLEEQLQRSIERRLIADVPVGTFMSGGIDSTTISAMAAKLHPGIKAFTLGYEHSEPELDEVPQATATAKMYAMEHVVTRVKPVDSLVDLPKWIEGYEEPYYGLAANHVISKIVKDSNVKVILNGLGGDELFAGYGRYRRIDLWNKLKPYGPILRMVAPLSGRYKEKLLPFLKATSASRLHTILYSHFTDDELQQIFQGVDEVNNIRTEELVDELYCKDLIFQDDIESFSYMDLVNYIGNHHVHRADQFTMMHSIEGRFPFLDHELVEAATTIPSYLKLNGTVQKYVLRKVAEKYIAPECLSMKKKGFGLPLENWMKGPLQQRVDDAQKSLHKLDFVNTNTIDNWFKRYAKGNFSPRKIWHLASLAMWHDTFIKQPDKRF